MFFFLFPLKYSNDGIIFEVEWHFPRSEHFGGKNRPKKKKKGKIALPFMVGYVLLSSYENNKKTYLTCKARRVVTKLEKEKHLS